MKKKILKILAPIMAAVLAFTVVHFAVLGNNTAADTTFTFAVKDGKAILTGSADTLQGAVVLPAQIGGYPVAAIGENAFKDCTAVTAFFLPDSITEIGAYAFENCTAMAQAILPNALTRIGAGAFWNCDALVSVTVPISVAEIGSCAFYHCDALESLIVLGASTPARGIFNVALDVGQTLAIANPAAQVTDPVPTTVYCYKGSVAMYDMVRESIAPYALLDDCTTTAYTVRYIDADGTALAEDLTVGVQPIGTRVCAVAIAVEDDTLLYPENSVRTITLAAEDNTIVFVYENVPETTTEESTTEEPTTEEPTTEEPTTEEPTTEEPSTEEPTTEEPTTEEPTTEEPTTEEPSTEPPRVPPVLYAKEGSTTVIDRERGYIYGLKLGISKQALLNDYLEVRGEGHIELSAQPGTGCGVYLVSDIDGQVVEQLTIIVFGDLNGDAYIDSQDITIMKQFASAMITPEDNPAAYFAGDIFRDEIVNNADITIAKNVYAELAKLNQATLGYSQA